MSQRTSTQRRRNPLTGDWILVSQGRSNRPWTGQVEPVDNDHFVVVVPYWAAWPFETLVIPKRCVGLLTELSAAECAAPADVIRRVSVCYDAESHYLAGTRDRQRAMEPLVETSLQRRRP